MSGFFPRACVYKIGENGLPVDALGRSVFFLEQFDSLKKTLKKLLFLSKSLQKLSQNTFKMSSGDFFSYFLKKSCDIIWWNG